MLVDMIPYRYAMGTAEVLASIKKDLKGTVKFIFNLQRKSTGWGRRWS
jgi:hypothetical protein